MSNLNFSSPVAYNDLGRLEAPVLIDSIKAHCSSGKAMHQDSLRAVVLKLTALSRDLDIRQTERDEAALMATHLANAALKSYGKHSDFWSELVTGIQSIVGKSVAV